MGDLPGIRQRVRQLAQPVKKRAHVGLGDLLKVAMRQPRSWFEDATLERDNFAKSRNGRSPERRAMSSRIIAQHSYVVRRGSQVPHPQRNRACREDESVTHRIIVTGRFSEARLSSAQAL